MGAGEEPHAAEPVGLNPLGTLETCGQVKGSQPEGLRVMISRPEEFTRDASLMIVSLGEALANRKETTGRVEMILSDEPLNDPQKALVAGRRCNATIVLWEKRGSRTLELTLPHPTQIPLKGVVQDKLCEFGDHSEQLTILYLTIEGLAAVREKDYDQANTLFRSANRLDDRCFRLPLADENDQKSKK